MTSDPASEPQLSASAHDSEWNLHRQANRWLSPDHPIGQSLIAARIHLQLAAWRPRANEDRLLKQAIAGIAPAFTMVDLVRLRQLARLAARVHEAGIEGAIVECGTWRGGVLALADWVLRQRGEQRELWGFDSFQGLPHPGTRDGSGVHRSFFEGWCAAGEDDVRRAIAVAGGDDRRLHLVKGWLSETLAAAPTGPIALLHVDVDWYDSVRAVLDTLFDRLSPAGIVNVDDYGRWRGCDEAVHDFLDSRGLPSTLLCRTGRYGAWLVKP